MLANWRSDIRVLRMMITAPGDLAFGPKQRPILSQMVAKANVV